MELLPTLDCEAGYGPESNQTCGSDFVVTKEVTCISVGESVLHSILLSHMGGGMYFRMFSFLWLGKQFLTRLCAVSFPMNLHSAHVTEHFHMHGNLQFALAAEKIGLSNNTIPCHW